MSDFIMGAEMRLTDNFSPVFSSMASSTSEFRSNMEHTTTAVENMANSVSSSTQEIQEFADTLTDTANAADNLETPIRQSSRSISGFIGGMRNLTSGVKEFARTKITNTINGFREFKTRVTGGETGIKGLWNATKHFAKTSLTGMHNGIKKVGELAVVAGKQITKHLGGALKTVSTGTLKGFGMATAALGAGAAAASAGIFKFTTMASDLDETLNKVDVAFGSSASTVKDWSSNSIKSMGLSKQTALDMTALFGDMGTSMGIPQKEAANMSMSLTQLGADLASFKNIGIDQATTALNGVFTGETESLKTLGIVMTQTNLDAFAMANGFGKTTKEMTEAEKVSLRYAYVMDKTKNAQGDFVRTGGGFANQLRQFKETMKDIGTNMGTIFIPSLTKGLQTLNKFGNEINDIFKDGWQDGDATKLADIFNRMIDTGVAALNRGLPKIVDTVVPIINTLVSGILKSLPGVVPVLLNGAMTLFNSLVGMIQQNKEPLITLAVDIVTSLANFLLDAVPQIILVGADLLIGFAEGLASQLPKIITVGVQSLVGLIQGIVSRLPMLIQTGLQLIRSLQESVWSALPQIIQAGVQILISLVQGIVQSIPMIIQSAINAAVSFIQTIISNLPLVVQAAVQIIVALVGGLLQAIPQLVAAVPQLVGAIIETIFSTNWLQVGWDIVKGIGKGLLDGIKGIFGGGGKDGGAAAATGVAEGLTANMGTINTASQTAANSITTGLQPDFTAINGYGMTATTGLATGLTQGAVGLNTTAMQLGTDATTNIATGLSTGTATVNTAAMQLGTDTVTGLSTGITDSIGLATEAATSTATVVTNEFKDIDLYDCGTNAMQGLIDGINAMKSSVMEVANSIANSVKTTINSALDIHSPSRVMEETGEYTGEGLVIGITKMIDKVKAAAQGLSNSTVEPFTAQSTNVQAISPSGVTQAPVSKREGLKIQIENIILQDVGDKDPKALVAEILQLLYDALSGADEVLSTGELGALL